MAFVLPETTNSDVRRAFQQINTMLDTNDIPLFRNTNSLNGLKDGRRALYHDGTNLWTYTRCRGKLYRTRWEELA